jgi:hypothetical protein
LRKEKQKNKRLAAQNANSIKTSNAQVCIECSYFKAVFISEHIESTMVHCTRMNTEVFRVINSRHEGISCPQMILVCPTTG